MVRQFEFGRQWARVTLTVLGIFCGVLAVFPIIDAFDPDNPDDLAMVYAVFGALQLVALVGAVVLSYVPAVNAYFREARSLGN
jgi:hypothetical protein